LPPEPLLALADEATTTLPIRKRKRISIIVFKTGAQKRNKSKIPFEDFGISLGRGVSLERLQGCSKGAVLLLDLNEPESNKFSTSFRARVVPLPPAEVGDVLLPATPTPAIEAFLVELSPEDFAKNFVQHFKGLARESS
jgi:hypothetical protein